MGDEIDGYGPRTGQSKIDRLLEDCRALSAASIERIAQAWMDDEGPGWAERTTDGSEQPTSSHAEWEEAERDALHLLETTNQSAHWDELRNAILDLTEGSNAMVSWRQEHGDAGHRAEDALLGAALGLMVEV